MQVGLHVCSAVAALGSSVNNVWRTRGCSAAATRLLTAQWASIGPNDPAIYWPCLNFAGGASSGLFRAARLLRPSNLVCRAAGPRTMETSALQELADAKQLGADQNAVKQSVSWAVLCYFERSRCLRCKGQVDRDRLRQSSPEPLLTPPRAAAPHCCAHLLRCPTTMERC